MNISHLLYRLLVAALLAVMLVACFTGVESTTKITDNDVRRAFREMERGRHSTSLACSVDSLPAWREGKLFWVVDNRVRLIFAPMPDVLIDTLNVLGKPLSYVGYDIHRQIDNTEVVDINFTMGTHKLVYPTHRSLADISHPSFSIPFMVDGDMINYYVRQVVGKTFFVKTSTWYTLQGDKLVGRKFVPVVITDVKPGNGVYPMRVEFKTTDNGTSAMLWMTNASASIAGRDFDSQFSAVDVRSLYPNIPSEKWALVMEGKVVIGMTKEECRLSLGEPNSVAQRPDQMGLREYWYYDGGRYLFFVDGLLKDFR